MGHPSGIIYTEPYTRAQESARLVHGHPISASGRARVTAAVEAMSHTRVKLSVEMITVIQPGRSSAAAMSPASAGSARLKSAPKALA